MWLRRGFYGWLFPAALVLPAWLLVGWAVTGAGGWAFLWVLFLAIPATLIAQSVLALLARARPTARAQHAVSWWDVLGFTVWHALIVSLGFFVQAWWGFAMVLAIFAGVGLLWLELWQLWREAKPSAILLRTTEGIGYIPPEPAQDSRKRTNARDSDVIVITEKPTSS